MIYFFYGSDKDAAREKALALADSLLKKKPEAQVFRLEPDRWQTSDLDELIGGQGLFNKSFIVLSVSLFENEEAKETFLSRLADVASSPNIFIVIEGDTDKKTVLALTDEAEKAQVFEKKEVPKKESFNIFALTDAFGRRDKKSLWLLFRQAVAGGSAPEEIHGVLFWQLKSMLLASQSESAEQAGLKPFVFTKGKSFAKNYSQEELAALSRSFVALYHDAHRGRFELETALERLVLSL